MNWPRSPFEKLEEWLFKQTRRNPFTVFRKELTTATQFKGYVAKHTCASCGGQLEVVKFERGHKGWESDIECVACHCRIVVSSHTTLMRPLNSKGRAREK